jgi:hypothetical protein
MNNLIFSAGGLLLFKACPFVGAVLSSQNRETGSTKPRRLRNSSFSAVKRWFSTSSSLYFS